MERLSPDNVSLRDFFKMESVVRHYAKKDVMNKAYNDMEIATEARKTEMFNLEALAYVDTCIRAKMVFKMTSSAYIRMTIILSFIYDLLLPRRH